MEELKKLPHMVPQLSSYLVIMLVNNNQKFISCVKKKKNYVEVHDTLYASV